MFYKITFNDAPRIYGQHYEMDLAQLLSNAHFDILKSIQQTLTIQRGGYFIVADAFSGKDILQSQGCCYEKLI